MPDTTLFQDIAQGLREAIAYERGELEAQTHTLSAPAGALNPQDRLRRSEDAAQVAASFIVSGRHRR